MRIFIGNLSFETTQADIEAKFKPFGAVTSVDVITDRDSGRSKGFGFVEMPKNEEANAAVSGLHGTTLGGRTVTVNEAKPRSTNGRPAEARRW